jgi:hypothetical protein
MNESSIQNSIRIALSEHGMVFRTNAGEYYQGNIAYSHEFKQPVLINITKIMGLPKGFTDLLFCGFNGQVAFVEVKTSTGRIRPEQAKFIDLMQKYKFKAGVARSVNDAIKIIKGEI